MQLLRINIKKLILCCFLSLTYTLSAAQSFNDFLKDSISFDVVMPAVWDKKWGAFVSGADIISVHMPGYINDTIKKLTNNDWKRLLKDSVLSYGANLLLYQITWREASGYEMFLDKKKWYRSERKSDLKYWFAYMQRKDIHLIANTPRNWRDGFPKN